MRILIVSDDAELQKGLVTALESRRRTCLSCDVQHATAEIRRGAPDVLVVHVATAEDFIVVSALSVLAGSMYVLALLGSELPARAVAAAIAAGAHDVFRLPYSREELHMRVDARERLCRWIGPTGAGSVTETRAWRYFDTAVTNDLEGMLCKTVKLTEKQLPPISSIQLATIPMTLPAEQLDLCISITADAAARKWLGVALFGDDAATNDVVQDIMRELANVVGGAFKRAALVERATVSMGIPVDNDPTPCGPNARYWEIETEDGGVIGLIADARTRLNRRVPARRLAEGMVVVKDVMNGSGVLLLPSGTRLTSTTAERLSYLLDQTLIDVCA